MGALKVGSTTHTNFVTLPLASPEFVELRLELDDGAVVEIRGHGIEIEPKGKGRHVEDLLPDLLPLELR